MKESYAFAPEVALVSNGSLISASSIFYDSNAPNSVVTLLPSSESAIIDLIGQPNPGQVAMELGWHYIFTARRQAPGRLGLPITEDAIEALAWKHRGFGYRAQ
ncbi:MAG: hypothetical protein ABL973_07865 [Micropepsaceae bacterium]